MQDDIKMFLKENLLGYITDEVISDIFGSDNNKVKGLIDSTKVTFKATCDALCKKWDTSEKTIHPEKNTLFSSYFRQNIAADIENGMLSEIREYLGLGNGFYFNNAQECSNKKLKSRIKESKVEISFGYCPSWVEGIKHYEKYVMAENKKTVQAVIGKGPFRISPEHSKYEVAESLWNTMTPENRRKHILKLNKFAKYFISADVL